MTESSKLYLFNDIKKDEFLNRLKEIDDLKINSEDINDLKEYNHLNHIYKKCSGHIYTIYKNVFKCLYVVFYENCLEYEISLNFYTDGLLDIKNNVPNFGENKSYIVIYLGEDDKSLSLMEELSQAFGGGVLIKNETSDQCIYLKDTLSIYSDIVYEDLTEVPDILLQKFIKYYVNKNDIKKINNKLNKKIKASELFKEFTFRSLCLERSPILESDLVEPENNKIIETISIEDIIYEPLFNKEDLNIKLFA